MQIKRFVSDGWQYAVLLDQMRQRMLDKEGISDHVPESGLLLLLLQERRSHEPSGTVARWCRSLTRVAQFHVLEIHG
jgi:hypothetical protein